MYWKCNRFSGPVDSQNWLFLIVFEYLFLKTKKEGCPNAINLGLVYNGIIASCQEFNLALFMPSCSRQGGSKMAARGSWKDDESLAEDRRNYVF